MHRDFTSIKDAVEYFTHLQDEPFTTEDIELKVVEEGIVTTNSGYIASLIKSNGFVFDKSLKKWFPKTKASKNIHYSSSKDTEEQLQFAKAKIERLQLENKKIEGQKNYLVNENERMKNILYEEREKIDTLTKECLAWKIKATEYENGDKGILYAKIERLEKDLHSAKEKIVILEKDYMTASTLKAVAQNDLANYIKATKGIVNKTNTVEKMNAEAITDIVHDTNCSKCIKRFFCKKYNDTIFPKIFKPCPEHRELIKHIAEINEVFNK